MKYKKGKFSRPLFFLDLSSRWDFICSFPVVFYICKGLGVFTIPTALLVSLLILITANYAGLYTVQKSNKYFRIFLSLILLILMFVRISFSGIGIQLLTQSDYLKNSKAKEILSQNGLLKYQWQDLKSYEEIYKDANEECNRYSNQLDNVNLLNLPSRQKEDTEMNIKSKMYAEPRNLPNSDLVNLLRNYSAQFGPCTIRNYIDIFSGVSDQNLDESLSNLSKIEESLNPLALLYVRSRGSYYAHFNGDGLAGEPYEMIWFNIDPSLGINIDRDCSDQDEKCIGPVRWASGNDAIRTSSIDFYERVGKKQFKNLGFSFLGFFISLVLNSITLISFITLPKKSK